MTTHIKNASSASQAARLNLLEEKVRNLVPDPDPDDPPDLDDVIAMVNRIYGITYDGAVSGAANPDDWSDNTLYFENVPSSGNNSFFKAIWGFVSGQTRFNALVARPLYSQLLSNSVSFTVSNDYSLASVTLGNDEDYISAIRNYSSQQSVLGAVFGSKASFSASMIAGKPLLNRVADLETKQATLITQVADLYSKLAAETDAREQADTILHDLIISRTS